MVDLEALDESDEELVKLLVAAAHPADRQRARRAAADGLVATRSARFVKVMPRDYSRVLTAEASARAEGREVEFHELVGATSA